MTRHSESLREYFVRGALVSGTLAAINKGLALLTAILLARTLGAEGFGYYAFAIGIISLLAVPAQLGLPQLITRELAASHALEQWDVMRGLRRRALQLAAVSTCVAGFAGLSLLAFADRIPAIERLTFLLAVVLLPMIIAMEVLGGVLRGLRKVIYALWPALALKPAIIVISLATIGMTGLSIAPSEAMLVNILATGAAVLVLSLMVIRCWPDATRTAKLKYRTRAWITSLMPFSILGAANLLVQKTDIVMLGLLSTPSDVGVYQVAVQGAMLVSFGFMAMNAVLGPNIARFSAQGDRARLQHLVITSGAAIFLIALTVMTVLLAFGGSLLKVVFGEEFGNGYGALVVLGVGQLVNASVGSVGTVLSMTGNEKDTLRAIVAAAFVNIVLNLMLIPRFGLMGAATATMLATVLWNVMMALSVHKRLGFIPSPIFARWIRKS